MFLSHVLGYVHSYHQEYAAQTFFHGNIHCMSFQSTDIASTRGISDHTAAFVRMLRTLKTQHLKQEVYLTYGNPTSGASAASLCSQTGTHLVSRA